MGPILSICWKQQSKIDPGDGHQELPNKFPSKDQKPRNILLTDENKQPPKHSSSKQQQRNPIPQSAIVSIPSSNNHLIGSQSKNFQPQIKTQQSQNSSINIPGRIPPQQSQQVTFSNNNIPKQISSHQSSNQRLSHVQQNKYPTKNKFEVLPISIQKQVIEEQTKLKNSPQFQKAQRKESNIEELIQISAQCHELQLYTESKSFCQQALSKIVQIQSNYSKQSIAQIKAHIYTQLLNVEILKTKDERLADEYFNQATLAYDKTIQVATMEERIALLNNYSVFKRNLGNLQASKFHLQQAIKLMEKYYVVSDQRKYLALINLACLEYETSRKPQARNMIQRVIRQCKNQEIVRHANNNLASYK